MIVPTTMQVAVLTVLFELAVRDIIMAASTTATRSTSLPRVAFDCEGVDLGRYGSVEVVSLCFEKTTALRGCSSVVAGAHHKQVVFLIEVPRRITQGAF
jgi:hypothetical protein